MFETWAFGIQASVGEHDLRYSWNRGKRTLQVNSEPCRKTSEYLACSGLVVWMGNEDLQLVRGPGDARRRYLDFAASQIYPDYRPSLRAYEKTVRSRNHLLKRDASPNWKEIDAYTEVLIRHGEVLTARRAQLIASLEPWANDAHHHVGGGTESLSIGYQSNAGDTFADSLAASRADELRRRVTLIGPHRDEVTLQIDGRPAAQFGSEGQQRTVALALKLAQARLLQQQRANAPLILVDDIFGELDSSRRNALLGYLPAEAQKLITTTQIDWLHDSTPAQIAAHYRVEAGAVERV